MIKTFLFILLFLFSCHVFAYEKELIVKEIINDEIIEIAKYDKSLDINLGDFLLIYSHTSKDVLGYARVLKISDKNEIYAKVLTHSKSGMIRPDNYLRRIQLTKAYNEGHIGRFDLMYTFNRDVLPMYRPLIYLGLGQGFTASNLVKEELIFGPTVIGYGLTNQLQASSNIISTIYKVPNIALKHTLFKTDEYEMSLEGGYMYFSEESRSGYIMTAYLDMISNSKFNSFFKIKAFTNKPADDYFYNSEAYEKDFNLEFSFSYGYVLDNWNRVIFGPKIDVNKKKVGGNIGYYYINQNLHALFGVSSNDFSEFRLGRDGYLLNLDVWWRF